MKDGSEHDEDKENAVPGMIELHKNEQQRIEQDVLAPVLHSTDHEADPAVRGSLSGDADQESKPHTVGLLTGHDGGLKVSPKQIHDLTTSSDSVLLRQALELKCAQFSTGQCLGVDVSHGATTGARTRAPRSTSTPLLQRKQSTAHKSRPQLPHLLFDDHERERSNGTVDASLTSPELPIPPMSLPTYLQLEISTSRPSPLYIRHDPTADFPYESSQVKFERLLNFLRLPPQLEQVLIFGTLACLDSWLYTFTILPLRFANAVVILTQWLMQNFTKEVMDISGFVYGGVGRLWQRRRQSNSASRRPSLSNPSEAVRPPVASRANSALSPHARSSTTTLQDPPRKRSGFRHRRTRSTPSSLLPNHKADLLQGLLIALSCIALMSLDASRMYHSIRGQAAIKLYVIYNVLEVFDRLFSALGQDVLECLFSREILERGPDGRSKVFRPLWMFALALIYNIVHATALFYQLVTLNVAVNSYSNALLTLLMSNQFVEIKGTVFKKFEKENLFQMTCADVVERFQLWVMLLIIALRNIVEVGGFNMNLSTASFHAAASATSAAAANATLQPSSGGGVIPNAFTLMPAWTGEVIGPFLIVLGSEMLVDWLKHAYITKFNNVKPNIYGRFLDVLTKDYYTHAFADQNLTKRLGLPVIPLSCLFIRASVQTYHMFLATHVPAPIASTVVAVSLETDPAITTPATVKALQHIDLMFRKALGRSSFGTGALESQSIFTWWSLDDIIALTTMAMVFLALYLILLAFKLVLGMALLSYSRSRYSSIKRRELQPIDAKGKRLGGWGTVEVGEDRRRWIYDDDKDGLKELQAKEAKSRAKAEKGELNLDKIDRYMMAAKRIW
ncbi:hypothetical protein AMS68_007306 [Peltaster fructicola]|uniref:DUF747 family protein n=1 Tax=Peltaster fructicola TaxID=286661 RepID=A0A6H0Y4L3_9PEZI|nr:hypothetical protein AMS68_007306 [Peltaster fructicola]